jgi:hypothetical protein
MYRKIQHDYMNAYDRTNNEQSPMKGINSITDL